MALRVGVIDIGSNCVRLVVFEGAVRAPLPVFNEKVPARLGRNIATAGRLDPEGESRALAAVQRFLSVAHRLGAETPEIVATSAVRDAENGREFAAKIEWSVGAPVRVLSGSDEARLAAVGVAAGIPEANGLVADLGGGSLELVTLAAGKIGRGLSLPIGPLRLMAEPRERAVEIVDGALAKLGWLWGRVRGRTLYAVGGAWRGFARIHLARSPDALQVVHHHRIGARAAASLARVLAGLSEKSLDGVAGLNRSRRDTMPSAAMLLSRVLAASGVAEIVASANGLREGVVHERLPPELQRRDPLLDAAARMAERLGRDGRVGDELRRWVQPLFEDAPPEEQRLIAAACLLSDIGWAVHPSYRSADAMAAAQHAPFVGIDHTGRCFVALAVGGRYGVGDEVPAVVQSKALLDDLQRERAERLGLALRLGYVVCGGGSGVLPRTRLRLEEGALTLDFARSAASFAGEKVERRLAGLAGAFDRRPNVAFEA